MSLPRKIKELRIYPRKRLGQHFVVEARIIERIIENAQLHPDDIVIEVGAGWGNLTTPLAERVKKVYAIEIDPRLVAGLRRDFQQNEKVEVIHEDALQVDFSTWYQKWQRPMKVVANLPYEISTPMIFRFFRERRFFSLLILMLQMEVARRIVASPGTKEYGPLSIWAELYSRPQIVFAVSPQAFYPPPRVDSAVVKFEILPPSEIKLENEEILHELIRSAFNYRRKTILNALKKGGSFPFAHEKICAAIKAAGISPQIRGEALTLKQFQDLSFQLQRLKEE